MIKFSESGGWRYNTSTRYYEKTIGDYMATILLPDPIHVPTCASWIIWSDGNKVAHGAMPEFDHCQNAQIWFDMTKAQGVSCKKIATCVLRELNNC